MYYWEEVKIDFGREWEEKNKKDEEDFLIVKNNMRSNIGKDNIN